MTDKLVPTSFFYEFSDDEVTGLLKIAKEIEKQSPIDIDVKKGKVKIHESEQPSSDS